MLGIEPRDPFRIDELDRDVPALDPRRRGRHDAQISHLLGRRRGASAAALSEDLDLDHQAPRAVADRGPQSERSLAERCE
jgi:hypothetical protein